ncbi:MAG: HNH endonuclease family protein [Porticoccus sp.]
MDVDHIVALAHAHLFGAASWTMEQKRAFVNDPGNLLVVDDSTNQSKSDKAPHEWMPPRQEYWCTYVAKWVRVKEKYKLSSSPAELKKIEQIRHSCP